MFDDAEILIQGYNENLESISLMIDEKNYVKAETSIFKLQLQMINMYSSICIVLEGLTKDELGDDKERNLLSFIYFYKDMKEVSNAVDKIICHYIAVSKSKTKFLLSNPIKAILESIEEVVKDLYLYDGK